MEPIFEYYDKLRYRILPYIYSTAITANMTGLPVCRAMPLVYEDDALQNCITQYMFGENFLVGAFTDEITLPAGATWIDYWTGKAYEGGQTIKGGIPENRGGYLFVKAGAIIPTDEPRQHTVPEDTKHIILDMYPCVASYYDFYEDDGETMEFKDGKRACTRISMVDGDGICNIGIGDREGEFKGMTDARVYTARVFASAAPQSVTVGENAVDFDFDGQFITFELGAEKEATIVF
jgi:alpha-glucosidase (family GH31 glycosyl hydrolase)